MVPSVLRDEIVVPIWRVHRHIGAGTFEAAARAGLQAICVITGGWSEQELRDCGAAEVYESIAALCRSLDDLPAFLHA